MIALVATVSGPTVLGGATAAIDTTGADFLIISTAWWTGGGGTGVTMADSKSNTWTVGVVQSGVSTDIRQQFFYCFSPIVGSGHTFTATSVGATTYPNVIVHAFSGIGAGSYSDRSGVGSTVGTPSALAIPGIITTENGALVITGWAMNGSAVPTVAAFGSFTTDFAMIFQAGIGGVSFNGAISYLVQPTAGNIGATWSWTGGTAFSIAQSQSIFLPGISVVSAEAIQFSVVRPE